MSRKEERAAFERRRRHDAPAPAPAPAPRRPRRRRRVTIVLLVTGVLVTGATFGAQWLLRQPYFRVQHVTFVGLRHEGDAAVLAASGLQSHPSMIGLDVESIRRHLAVFPWIKTVTVTKHWPNSVVVTVTESVAVAVAFAPGHHLEFVSASGAELGPAPSTANLPTLVYGTTAPRTWPFAKAGRAAAYVAGRLPRAFTTQVATITVTSAGDVTLKMTTPLTFVLGPATQLHAKFVAVASVIAHSTLVPGDVVDVTVPDELAVSGPGTTK